MLRVREVQGPAVAEVGATVQYQAVRFDTDAPAAADLAAIRWLVKAVDEPALTRGGPPGPTFTWTVEPQWAGLRVRVMAYGVSPSSVVAALTDIRGAPEAGPLADADAGTGTPPPVEIGKDGRDWWARVGTGTRFPVGTEVRYGTRRGLMNSHRPFGPRYRADDWRDTFGHWADLLRPTIAAESRGAFTCLNSYDRAAFTFGLLQHAAHTPDANLVLMLRHALALPQAAWRLPELGLAGGRIRDALTGAVLETPDGTGALMACLNPRPDQVDEQEVRIAARLMAWLVEDATLRANWVAWSVADQRRRMVGYARELPLEGVSDRLCAVVLDVRHQGRARNAAIRAALASADPLWALLDLGAAAWHERIATLDATLRELEAEGRLGQRVWSGTAGDFIIPEAT